MFKHTVSILLLVSCLFIASCSKDDQTPRRNTYKVTATLTGIEDWSDTHPGDYISVTVAGNNTDASAGNTLWTVNGQTMTGEVALGLDRADFMANSTLTVESINPLDFMQVSIQFLNYKSNLTYQVQIEKNGKIEIDESGTLTDGADFTKNYSF